MKCHCGSDIDFKACCEPVLRGERVAESPEALMRSRFSAFCVKDVDYLVNSTDPQTRLGFDFEETAAWAKSATFTKLEILRSTQEGNKGMVEFKATFQMPDQPVEVHHEISKFRKQAGVWYFREGKLIVPRPPSA